MSVSEIMPKSPFAGLEHPPAGKKATQSRSRVRFNQAMRLVRRSHLYAGLFMTPWVFLYGVTALLFNHPSAFPDQSIRSIEAKDFAGTPLETPLDPKALAAQVVGAINASGDDDSPSYKLVRAEEAGFARDYFTTIAGEGESHSVRIDLGTGSGTVRSSPRRTEAERPTPAPFAARPIRLASAPMDSITKSLGAVLARKGLPPSAAPTEGRSQGRGEASEGRARGGRRRGDGDDAEPVGAGGERRRGGAEKSSGPSTDGSESRTGRGEARSDGMRGEEGPSASLGGPGGGPGLGRGGRGAAGPELNFAMEGAGKVWQVGYNLQTGALSGRPEDLLPQAGEPLSNRRFLLRLHTAHGYPSEFGARWIWAIAVDVMFLCMVGWGATGLLMWWQMKNVRKIGAVLIALSIVVSIASAIGMHGSMINP